MTPDTGSLRSRSARELARRLTRLAVERELRVATAESCTGGLVAKVITDHPGASACFAGGVVAYANDVKVRHLGVRPEDLATHGAVSRIVAQQMASGACRTFSADVALAVTGIAGPSGGGPDKPVGTVWVAVALSDGTGKARMERFTGDRRTVREDSAAAVLGLAAELIADGDS